jgi:hypothetical protein
MSLFFTRRPKPRKFDYRPVYYDAEKEELEERRKELEGIQEGDPKARLKSAMRRKWRRRDEEKDKSSSAIRTIIYLIIFGLSVYLLFFTDFLKNLLSFFNG